MQRCRREQQASEEFLQRFMREIEADGPSTSQQNQPTTSTAAASQLDQPVS
jgi:hypothetical protein